MFVFYGRITFPRDIRINQIFIFFYVRKPLFLTHSYSATDVICSFRFGSWSDFSTIWIESSISHIKIKQLLRTVYSVWTLFPIIVSINFFFGKVIFSKWPNLFSSYFLFIIFPHSFFLPVFTLNLSSFLHYLFVLFVKQCMSSCF